MAANARKDAQAGGNVPALWMMLPAFATMRRLEKLERFRPPRFVVSNLAAVTHDAPALGRDDAPWFATMPAPRLSIRHADFAPDFIWAGLFFASARFRAALGIGAGSIEYRSVEMDRHSADAALSADYQAFRAVRRADLADLSLLSDRDRGGGPTLDGQVPVSGPHAPARRAVWRQGFVAPAPLFTDPLERLVATDELAARVMAAGLRDVAFLDVASDASPDRLVFRAGPVSEPEDPPS